MAGEKDDLKDKLGISDSDIDSSYVFSMGHVGGEMEGPYKNEEHRKKVEMIKKYTSSKKGNKFAGWGQAYSVMDRAGKLVEVVGSQTEACVADTVVDSVNHGKYVYVDFDKIFTLPEIGSSEHNKDALLTKLKDQNIVHVPYKKGAIFYKE